MVIYSVFCGLYLQIIWNNFSEIKGELVCSGRITRMLKCLQSGRRYRIASFNWFLLFDQKIVSWKCSCSDSLLWIYSDEECARGLNNTFSSNTTEIHEKPHSSDSQILKIKYLQLIVTFNIYNNYNSSQGWSQFNELSCKTVSTFQ